MPSHAKPGAIPLTGRLLLAADEGLHGLGPFKQLQQVRLPAAVRQPAHEETDLVVPHAPLRACRVVVVGLFIVVFSVWWGEEGFVGPSCWLAD